MAVVAGAALVAKGVDDVRSGDDSAHDKAPQTNPASAALEPEPSAKQFEAAVRDVLCDQMTSLLDSPEAITAGEAIDSAIAIAQQRFTDVKPRIVEDLEAAVATTTDLSAEVSPAAARAYLRGCAPS